MFMLIYVKDSASRQPVGRAEPREKSFEKARSVAPTRTPKARHVRTRSRRQVPAECIVRFGCPRTRTCARADRHPNRRRRGWRSRYRSGGVRSRRRIRREHEPRIPRLSEFARERASVENRPRPRTSARAPPRGRLVLNARPVRAFESPAQGRILCAPCKTTRRTEPQREPPEVADVAGRNVTARKECPRDSCLLQQRLAVSPCG
jgi:hypothetical protein